MKIIILGALGLIATVVTLSFVKRIVEIILAFFLYIIVIVLSSAAIISYIISRLFDLDFIIVFPTTLILAILLTSIIINYYQPAKKVEQKSDNVENFMKDEADHSMGLLKSTVKAVVKETVKNSESVENIKSATKDVLKETAKNIVSSQDVKSALKQSIKNPFKKSEKAVANSSDIDKMNAIRFNSSHLTDEQLLDYFKNESIDLYEKMGYAAAFADRYPPEK